jgi:predicted secreted acid phosphatase
MVFVDFSNPYLRYYFSEIFLPRHKISLKNITTNLGIWKDKYNQFEKKKQNPRKLAVTLDIDEVILCNIHMNSYGDFHASDLFQTKDGKRWNRNEVRLNPLLPGALELINELCRLDIHIFFVTGRKESLRSETIENFEYVGLFNDVINYNYLMDNLIMCPDNYIYNTIRNFKENSRANIEKNYRIIVNVGDQASDLGEHGDLQIQCMHPFYIIC